MSSTRKKLALTALVAAAAAVAGYACAAGRSGSATTSDAAQRVYVAPGTYDKYYAFLSGGFNGGVSVYGLPSGRLLKQIAVFSQFPEKGWGYSEETKPMLNTTFGFIPWDDAHHPELSMTNGVPNGKWLFINANNTPRIARLDLTRFETEEILQIPNSSGNHSSPFSTPDGKYVVAGTRFSVPIPEQDEPIADYQKNFKGTISFIRADQPGKMDVAFQIMMPGYDYDLGHAGKGPSDGWFFFTTYNTEQAKENLEVNASQNDKDFIAAINYRQAESCLAQGQGHQEAGDYAHNWVDENSVGHSEIKHGVKLLIPAECPGLVYFLPTPKSPHGVDVDPTGEYIVGDGKLSTVIPVHSFSRMVKAIAAKQYEKVVDGIPVLKYEAVLAGEVKNPGLGPLHTEFDGKGNAYTTMFVSSEVVKWKLGTWEVVDRKPVYYSPGHLMIPGGDSQKPWGEYVLVMDKITKDRYLPTGPELAQSAQLFDITGDKMKLLLDFPTTGEPHYAGAIPASLIREKSQKIYDITKGTSPFRVKSEQEAGVVRRGSTVHVFMTAIRSHFMPDNIEGIQVGDTVKFHVTNLEQDWDIPHGFAVMANRNAELLIMPGQTLTLTWVPQQAGIYPFYCTDFCSALHQEMQGYLRVSPAGSSVALTSNAPNQAANAAKLASRASTAAGAGAAGK